MTLTPDRTPGKNSKHSDGAAPGEAEATCEPPAATGSQSFREQLEAVGIDLTGNPLAGKLDAMAAVPPTPIDESGGDKIVEEASLGGGEAATLLEGSDESSPSDDDSTAGAETARADTTSAEAAETSGTAVGASVPHPLLSETEWRDLDGLAPELTSSIGNLSALKDAFLASERPIGPDQAMTIVNGIETATRILEAMSAVALSVYERCGTPTDYGAKTTKALVQNRLNLTGYEAYRRTELAKNLGDRVSLTGQVRGPANPIVAQGLHSGALSAGQATAINDCLSKLPTWVSQDVRTRVETDLVEKAPEVRVSDLRSIFNTILDRIDPDGEEPTLPPDRSKYRINVRARDDGDWDLTGLLDAVAGGVLNGLLTSRILPNGQLADSQGTEGEGSNGQSGSESGSIPDFLPGAGSQDLAGSASESGQAEFDIFRAVLAGDISDAPVPTSRYEEDTNPVGDAGSHTAGDAASDQSITARTQSGFGVREDGTVIDTSRDQGTVRNRIYERFATMISRIEMNRVGRGSPFALVVTAKAQDVAAGKGRAITGCEAEFPMSTAVAEGLNGSVFFHLMSEKAKTMEIATEGRFATPKQVAIITARDQGCTFPGCDSPPGWCDAHHVVPWSDKGRTDINNLTLACGLHHHLIDDSDWHAVMLKDGRPAWIPPSSIDIERRPILHSRFIAQEIIDGLSEDPGLFGP